MRKIKKILSGKWIPWMLAIFFFITTVGVTAGDMKYDVNGNPLTYSDPQLEDKVDDALAEQKKELKSKYKDKIDAAHEKGVKKGKQRAETAKDDKEDKQSDNEDSKNEQSEKKESNKEKLKKKESSKARITRERYRCNS